MSSIFISYRRDETRDVAGRVYDRLTSIFGRDSVFRDVYTIPGGADFAGWIGDAIAKADVVIALMGDRWSTIADNQNRRRIDDPEDWVRLEIANALELNKLVVPVLVERAQMPSEDDLPVPLRALARHQAIELSDRRFEADVAELIKVLRERVPGFGSKHLGPGSFRGLGTFHVHIDGDDEEHIQDVIGELAPEFPTKLNRITGKPVRGPQRDDPDFELTYRFHTPGPRESEDFSVFSTTLLGTGSKLKPNALQALKQVIKNVTRRPGAVVEFERVVATIDENGVWREEELIADPPELWALTDECNYPRLSTFPIEIHHAIDIPKESGVPPLDLIEDVPKCPSIGGWFLFEKDDCWAYRSNQFADWSDYEHYAKDGDARLRSFVAELRARGLDATLRTMVEQVLGIWKGDDDLRRKDFKSVPDLARWEMEAPGEFWVVAANFLGDKSPDVKNAMVQNLMRKVTYTYFVRSYADVFRLNMLRSELEDSMSDMPGGSRLDAHQAVVERIRCVLLRGVDSSLEQLLERDYFIYPETKGGNAEGYKLQRGSIGGQKVDEAQVNDIVAGLAPLLRQRVEGFYLSVPQEIRREVEELRRYAIVCTDLDYSETMVGHKRWQRRLAHYDRIVAREVSMFRYGDVVRPVRNGYLVVFEQVKDAAEFAKRLQSAVKWHNESARKAGRKEDTLPAQIVSLEFGLATRVPRAHGDDYVGEAIDKCTRRLGYCADLRDDNFAAALVMSDDFAASYVDELGEEPFIGRTRAKKSGAVVLLDPQVVVSDGSGRQPLSSTSAAAG